MHELVKDAGPPRPHTVGAHHSLETVGAKSPKQNAGTPKQSPGDEKVFQITDAARRHKRVGRLSGHCLLYFLHGVLLELTDSLRGYAVDLSELVQRRFIVS